MIEIPCPKASGEEMGTGAVEPMTVVQVSLSQLAFPPQLGTGRVSDVGATPNGVIGAGGSHPSP